MKAAIGILCGGKSRRMGRNKAELEWNGATLLAHLASSMLKDDRKLYLSVADAGSLAEPFRPYAVEDGWKDCGPLGGIASVLNAADTEAVFFCAVDMPYVSLQTVEYLEQCLTEEDDGVCFVDGERMHPLCAIYRKRFTPVIEKQLASGDYRMRKLAANDRIRKVPFDPGILCEKTLWNLNTPDDYAKAAKHFCRDGVDV